MDFPIRKISSQRLQYLSKCADHHGNKLAPRGEVNNLVSERINSEFVDNILKALGSYSERNTWPHMSLRIVTTICLGRKVTNTRVWTSITINLQSSTIYTALSEETTLFSSFTPLSTALPSIARATPSRISSRASSPSMITAISSKEEPDVSTKRK